MSAARLASITILSTFFACLDRPPGSPEAQNEPVRDPTSPVASSSPSSNGQSERARAGAENERVSEGTGVLETHANGASPAESDDAKDPTGGAFTLADATAGLAGSGPLVATIKTSKGALTCRLFDDKAPITVANFVGLARGTRPFKSHPDGRWVKKAFYDGTTFHRIIKGFMIQGGDQRGTGIGDPGYDVVDEIWPGATHDRAGLLCMANRGKNTNGSQFFITDAPARQLDGNYTIFGECSPVSVVREIASVPKGPGDRPLSPVTIDRIEISR
jgi:peptidyl-prolyl cis-trans isomerase A (cyclophilin A)